MPASVKPVVLVTTRFMEDDHEFLGDYAEIVISIDGQVAQTYGDASHDKGRERAAGYLDGLKQAWGDDSLVHESVSVADYV